MYYEDQSQVVLRTLPDHPKLITSLLIATANYCQIRKALPSFLPILCFDYAYFTAGLRMQFLHVLLRVGICSVI